MRSTLALVLALASAPLHAIPRPAIDFPVVFAESAASLDAEQRALVALHVQEAGRRWASELQIDGDRSIEIEIALDPWAPTANAGSLSTSLIGTHNGIAVWEQGVAAELRTGIDPKGVTPDARITFGATYFTNELWFDPDPATRSAPVPADRTDAFSVILHELGHAIAYNGWADGNGAVYASYMSPFDRWMISGAPPRFDGPLAKAVWGSRPDLTRYNVMHWGNAPGAKAAPAPRWIMPVFDAEGRPVPPIACEGLPSIDTPPSRDDLAKAGPASLLDQLMNGVAYYRGKRYDISELDIAVLADVGLDIVADIEVIGIFRDGFETP